MSIKCGHCRETHETLEAVRECSRAAHGARSAAQACGCPVTTTFAHRDGCRYEGMGRVVAATAPVTEDPAWGQVTARHAPRAAQAAPAGTLAEEGVYRRQGRIYRVITKGGRRFAEEYVRGAYCYAKGMVYRLQPADRMTLEECQAWGRQEVRCIRCGTPLEKAESRAAGIGPVCATKV